MKAFGLEVRRVKPAQTEGETKRPFQGAARMFQRMFDAGSSDRLTQSWTSMPMTADDVIRRNLRVLVARCREQAANNGYARKFIGMCHQNIVGPRGLLLQAKAMDSNGKPDLTANSAIEKAFEQWAAAEHCDVTGQQSWRSIQNSCVVSAAKDGEFMLQLVYGKDAGEWGFALQMLDPQRCPVDFDQSPLSTGGFIRHGIEYNRYGRPVAYYFTTTNELESDYCYGGRNYVKVPAEQIIHGFVPEMVGQKRGLPWMATGLWRLKMLEEFEKAALVNARVSAAKGGFFQWQQGAGPEVEEDQELYMDGELGGFYELPEGVEFKAWNPDYPTGEFAAFHKCLLRGISSGWKVAYNSLANDLEGVNFSSIRQGALDEREHWKELQEWLIESLASRVFKAWLPVALLNRKIITATGAVLPPRKLDKYLQASWQARRWQWIDPKADTLAATTSMGSLLASPSQIIRDQGRDPETVWREIAEDLESMQSSGIPPEAITAAMNSESGSGNADNEEQKK